jgi:DNA-binding NtrC family response regulator
MINVERMLAPEDYNGWMLLEEKKNPRVRGVPVIMETAKPPSPMAFTERKKGGIGFFDYINKPFTKEELIGTLRDAWAGYV